MILPLAASTSLMPPPASPKATVFPSGLAANDWFYYLTWGCALLAVAAAWLLLRGRIGRAFRAIRDSEVAASASGVNLAVYKTVSFGISAAFAGVAGSLLSTSLGTTYTAYW